MNDVDSEDICAYTAHLDTFAADHLPPRDQWPDFRFELPELQYPERINCGELLLDAQIERGRAKRRAQYRCSRRSPAALRIVLRA